MEEQELFFESTSKTIKVKNLSNGEVFPLDSDPESASFYLNPIHNGQNEKFSLGLVVQMIDQPMYLCTEKLLMKEEVNSYDDGHTFGYTANLGQE